MNAVERLRRDHHVLRGKLDMLEAALSFGPARWFTLRELCFTLTRQLADHMKREERLVEASRRALPMGVLADLALEHKDEPELLRSINELFLSESGYSLRRIRPTLQAVILRLRRHMDEEEAELFPLLREDMPCSSAVSERGSALPFDETATVNRVIQQFPQTKPVFEQLFVDTRIEGYDCLDEVAWRHGMDVGELFTHLEAAIPGREPGLPQREPDEAGHLAAA